MKKIVGLLASVIILANIGWAQSAGVAAANRKTAQRCLQLAENCMLGGDWKNALSQAELGLAYDSAISDLIFVKATAQNKLGFIRADILSTIETAFEVNNWVNYNENNARILYADLLSETGKYDESLAVLDRNPFIYSADAEFIRIKNYYRIGTEDSITQARAKLNSSRKIYPNDERFPQLFFIFECMYMNYAEKTGVAYEIPDFVQTIADSYIVHFPDYDKNDLKTVEMEIMALMFAHGEQQTRLLKAIGEQNQSSPLFAYAGLKTGILSEEKAYNLFFENSSDTYYLDILECFTMLIKNEGLKENLSERLNAFTGTMIIDEDLDWRNELVVQYERGRPVYVNYDKDNNQIIDLYAVCDFGVPMMLSFNGGKVVMNYDIYPAVKKVSLVENHETFHFLNDDFVFTPFEMQTDKYFGKFCKAFFVPYIDSELAMPDEYILAQRASCVELPTAERYASNVIYTVFAGKPVFATFSDSYSKYAFATIEPGCPFVRYVDYDNDQVYETAETYDIDRENAYTNEDEVQLIKKIFGENTFSANLYLKKVEVDRNSDTKVEYKEEFLGHGGKMSSWDNDNNGIWDYEYIRYPLNEKGEKEEESIFYNSIGLPHVILKSVNDSPKTINVDGNEINVIPAEKEKFYWIGEKGTVQQEDKISKSISSDFENGLITLVPFDDNLRLSVIKIDGNYYCKLLPPSESIEDEENK